MKKDLKSLERIQTLDKEIYNFQTTMDEAPEQMEAIISEVEQEIGAFHVAEAELKELQLQQKAKEGDLKEKESAIQKHEGKLSQVKTNQEYSALQSEIRSLKADNSMLEEKIIELFDSVDASKKKLDSEKEKMAEIEKAANEKKKVIEAKVQEAKSNIDGLKEQKRELMKEVDKEIATLYERIVSKKQGIALVRLDDQDVCPACHVQLRPQQINEVKLGESIVLCEQCSRILYS